jgi:hypothetical protein
MVTGQITRISKERSMTDQQTQTQPQGWGLPPPHPPEPPKRRRTNKIILIIAGSVVALLVLVGIVGSLAGSDTKATRSPANARQTPAATTPTATTPAATESEEGFPEEGTPATSAPTVANQRVGEVATLVDTASGEDVARVVISRVKTSRGDEYNRPERGTFLGVYVKTKALADEQTSLWGDIYVIMRGHHYDGDAYAEGFEPSLDYVDLNAGETAEGWLVFDVPASHGKVVLVNTYDNSKIGTWSF